MKYRLISILILTFYYSNCIGQSVESNKKSAEFETEDVSSNGAMNYNIPIATISGDELSKSVGLGYYSGGGIMVSELSSNVGLGWSLTGLDVITRNVNGIPDEGYFRNDVLTLNINGEEEEDIGKIFKGWLQEPVFNGNNEDKYLSALGVTDSAPDEFQYTAGAYSGSFHFSHADENNISESNLIIVNHQKNNVLIEASFNYVTEDGAPCSSYVSNCNCGTYVDESDECVCDGNFYPAPSNCPGEYCDCCFTSCSGYQTCLNNEANCESGINSVISRMTFKITTPNGEVYYYGGFSNSLLLEDKSASLSSGVELDRITINAGVTNAWRINKIETTKNQNNTFKDVIDFEYDAYESYAYVDVGTQKLMMKSDIPNNKLNDSGEAIHMPCHDYFNKYFAQENSDGVDVNEEAKNYQNILYDRGSWNITQYINALRVKKIKTKYEVIEYHYDQTPRKDLYSGAFVDTNGDNLNLDGIYPVNYNYKYDYPRALDYISQYANDGSSTYTQDNLIKRFEFITDYYHNTQGADIFLFNEVPTGIEDASDDLLTVDCNRLILTEIALLENDLSASQPQRLVTSFSYDLAGFGGFGSSHIHRRCSLGRDYWGYNNGITYEESSLIPILPFETNSTLRPHLSNSTFGNDCFSTQDRTSKWPQMRAGMLTEVNLPSGADMIYTYGPNSVLDYPFTHLNGTSDKLVGGVRLEKVTVKNDANQIELEEELFYEEIIDATDPTIRQASGKLLYIPTFVELFDQGHDMLIHNGNYDGSPSAVCSSQRTLSVRGAIYSNSITPRVTDSGHIGYASIIKKVDKGFTETKYIMPSDDELLNISTPTSRSFGMTKYVSPSTTAMRQLALKRGHISELNIYEENNAGTVFTKAAENTMDYNVSYGNYEYRSSQNEYGGMPFQKTYKWSSQFVARLGSSIFSPLTVAFHNKDIPADCEATKIDNSSSGGQHNYFVTAVNSKLYGRVEQSRKTLKVDGVTIITEHEYTDFDVSYQGHVKSIHVPKRIVTYPEANPTERQVKVYSYAGESIYNDENDPHYQANSPLILNRPTGSSPNTIELLQSKYIHTPVTNQEWFRFYDNAGNLTGAQFVSGTLNTMILANNIVVPECNYEFMGDTWNLRNRITEWNENGTARITHKAYIDTEYTDAVNATHYNPNYVYQKIENGLLTENYIESPTERLNHTRHTYYDDRMIKSELLYKTDLSNIESVMSGSYKTYDNFNRSVFTYEGISVVDNSGIPITYKTKKTQTYKVKGLGDIENSQTISIDYSNSDYVLNTIVDHQLLDDLARNTQLTRSNTLINPISFVSKTQSYNNRGSEELVYTLGRDTKAIKYENSPLDRKISVESLEVVDDESIDIVFGTNEASEIFDIVPNSLFKSEIKDIDGRTVTRYTDYFERLIVERRFNDSGSESDTKHIYDNKGRLEQINPSSGPSYSYSYNNRGLIASKIVPHSGERQYFYDKLLRPVLEVDANNNFKVTIYDNFDRIVKTGLKKSSYNIPNSINYYFNINELNLDSDDIVLTETSYEPSTGFISEEKELILDPNSSNSNIYLTNTYNTYDDVFGEATSVDKENILGGVDNFEYKYNDSGEVYYSLHKNSIPGEQDRYFQQKTYFDEMNRPWKNYLSFEDNESVDGQLLSEIEYDEYSRIRVKKLHEVSVGDYLQEIDFEYDEFGRILKINDKSTMYDNCAAPIYCTYELIITSQSDAFQLDKLFYQNTSFFDLSTFNLSSLDDGEVIAAEIISEIENQISQGDGEGPLPVIIIDGISYQIEQLAGGDWQLTFTLWQTNYEFESLILNEDDVHLLRKDCCGDAGAITDNDFYWQELSYLNYIEDPLNNGQTITKNSGNIHRKDYGYTCGNSKSYLYQYDALNRLKIAFFNEGITPNLVELPSIQQDGSGLQGTYSTQINYENDLGDIGQIYRFGPGSTGIFDQTTISWGLQDAIDYSYSPSGQLFQTTEYGELEQGHQSINQNGVNAYGYDQNGNMISDSGKGISTIDYTYFNLPHSITKSLTNESLDFIYGGSGMQLQKRHSQNNAVLSLKSYINGIEYVGTTNSNSEFDSFYHTDGVIKLNDDGSYAFQYFIKDHISNIVVLFGDKNNNGFLEEYEVVQQNDFYPFGSKMLSEGTQVSPIDNQYLYNGNEMNRELNLNMYAYGTRFFDPFIARFQSVDPIADELFEYSVYNYASNNPISNDDYLGLYGAPPMLYQIIAEFFYQEALATAEQLTLKYFPYYPGQETQEVDVSVSYNGVDFKISSGRASASNQSICLDQCGDEGNSDILLKRISLTYNTQGTPEENSQQNVLTSIRNVSNKGDYDDPYGTRDKTSIRINLNGDDVQISSGTTAKSLRGYVTLSNSEFKKLKKLQWNIIAKQLKYNFQNHPNTSQYSNEYRTQQLEKVINYYSRDENYLKL